jgi:hypothetical protein
LLLLRLNLIDDTKQTPFNELNESFEHLRLAGEMTVKRRLRAVQTARERRCSDLLAFRILKHRGQHLQYLQPSLTRLRHVTPARH